MDKDTDFLTSGIGLENLTAAEMGRPFIKICQQMTPERDATNPEHIPGLKEGDIFNSLTKKVYGNQITLRFLARGKLWLVYDWGTDGKNGNYIATVEPNSLSVDDSNYGLWVGEFEGKKVRVKEGYNFIALVKGEEAYGPVIVPFFSMGNHDAQALTRKLGTDRSESGAPYSIFAREWTLTTNPVKKTVGNATQTFYLYGDGKKTINAKRSETLIGKEEFYKLVEPLVKVANQFLMLADRDTIEQRALPDNTEALASDTTM